MKITKHQHAFRRACNRLGDNYDRVEIVETGLALLRVCSGNTWPLRRTAIACNVVQLPKELERAIFRECSKSEILGDRTSPGCVDGVEGVKE